MLVSRASARSEQTRSFRGTRARAPLTSLHALAQVNRVVINVPATSANLGPGFDSFGFALDVWNRVIVERADSYSMTITGEGADRLDNSSNNMVARMANKAMASLGISDPPKLRFECQNAVPPTRGMGSSSAALVAGLAAGLAFGGKDMSTPATKKLLLQVCARGSPLRAASHACLPPVRLPPASRPRARARHSANPARCPPLSGWRARAARVDAQLAADAEGHADNVAPAIYGGTPLAGARTHDARALCATTASRVYT